MVKEIERVGLPAVQITTIIPIALTVGANRVVPGIAIPHPTGKPGTEHEEEVHIRRALLNKALVALSTTIAGQTVFR